MKSSFMQRFCHLNIIFCVLLLVAAGCQKNENAIVLNDNNGANYNPVIDPVNFVSPIDNPYFTLTPGKVWIYTGTNKDGATERVEVEVTQDTKTILGVVTTVVRDRVWEDGELIEDTYDWYAQHKDGTVWYFGEDTKEFEHGKVVTTKGSWEAGVNGGKAGILMKGNPQVGDAYRQEFLPGVVEDMGQVLSISESVSIGLGSFKNCLKTKEWTPIEPDYVDHKFYCKEAGNPVLEKKVVGGPEHLELIEMKTK